jgi:hypothetical protein
VRQEPWTAAFCLHAQTEVKLFDAQAFELFTKFNRWQSRFRLKALGLFCKLGTYLFLSTNPTF